MPPETPPRPFGAPDESVAEVPHGRVHDGVEVRP